MRLQNKTILLGITGSIAAYKTPELIRFLQKNGAKVQVMVTPAALQFVTLPTLEALSGGPVIQGLSEEASSRGNIGVGALRSRESLPPLRSMPHIVSTRTSDLIVVAPASANTLAKLAYGMADDAVSATVLAARIPVLIAPAMNDGMWQNPLVQGNLKKLKKAGYHVVDPENGYLACGDYGEGRLIDLQLLYHHIVKQLTIQDFSSKKVLITAGATREYFDPVRFLSNGSSGKMAFCLALEAYYRGAEVQVISGFTEHSLTPFPFEITKVKTAEEMEQQVSSNIAAADIFIAAAAVSDFRPAHFSSRKIKKFKKELTLRLRATTDILEKVVSRKKKPFIVGFALETHDVLAAARLKMRQKPVDLLVLNTEKAIGMDRAKVSFLSKNALENFGMLTKENIARKVFDHFRNFNL
jgi:phosphopantothenoylcysteine decarboxylase/phosphopantothenate--cysteine ligase